MSERRDRTARRREDRPKAHRADGDLASRPVVLGERRAIRGREHDVRAIAHRFDADVVEGGGGDDVDRGVVDEGRARGALRDLEQLVGDVGVLAGREYVLGCGPRDRRVRGARRGDADVTAQQLGEHAGGLVVRVDRGAVGQGDPWRAVVPVRAQREQASPGLRVLGTRDAPGLEIEERDRAIAGESADRDLGLGEVLAEHRLHGIATQRRDGSELEHHCTMTPATSCSRPPPGATAATSPASAASSSTARTAAGTQA